MPMPKRAVATRNVQITKLNIEIHLQANRWFAADKSVDGISDIFFNEV